MFIILIISGILQLIAVILAFRLIRITKKSTAWIIFVIAFFLMEIRRLVPLFKGILMRRPYPYYDSLTEVVALLTSALFIIGIALIAPLFKSIKRSEKELYESREWFSTLLKSIGEIVVSTNANGQITFVNPVTLTLTNLKQEDLVNKFFRDVFEIISNEIRDNKDDVVNRVLKGGEVIYLKDCILLVTKAGKKIPVDITAAPIKDSEEKITGSVLIFYDITARKQIEEAIRFRKEAEILTTILNGNPIPTFVIDSEHKVVLWNQACEILTGVSTKDVLGRGVNSNIFYPDKSRPVLADVVLDMNMKLMMKFYETKKITKSTAIPEAFEAQDKLTINGVERDIYFLAARLKDFNGKIIGAIETLQDVTEKEQLHLQLLHAQKMEAVGKLAGSIAHDFNNLLVIINGYSDLLLKKIDRQSPDGKDIEAIKKAGDRAGALTRQLLTFSRRRVLQPKVVDLNELIKDIEKLLLRLIGEDISLITNLDLKLERIKADPGQIEQIIMNLIVNAKDAMPNGGRLIIKTENTILDKNCCKNPPEISSGLFISLSISDSGIGMDTETIEHIFEPFFTTKGEGRGTGLGLSTVYGIVKQHGGCITVDSQSGKGSTFHIYLPALLVDAQGEDNIPILAEELKGNGEKVLLVEDEGDVADFITTTLINNGYKVFKTKDAEEAISTFFRQKKAFDLIFSDVVLPGMNGVELVDRLSSQKSGIKILLSSGYIDEKSRWSIIHDREIKFLQKPYTVEGLLRAVREAIEDEKQRR
ncbi:MAG: PAS domain S-box protein [bacterium]